MQIAEKEHKKKYKKDVKQKSKIVPTWFNEKIDETEKIDDEEFNSFIEEFKK